jgi:hypothetical protein
MVAFVAGLLAFPRPVGADGSGQGRDERALGKQRLLPAVEALFEHESYRPGAVATLVVTSRVSSLGLQLFRVGAESSAGQRRYEMRGTPVTDRLSVSPGARGRVRVRMGDWPSGVYYAELRAGGRVGYAPFVLAPRLLGQHSVAIVMPTNTWFAYNRRDVDGDGYGDTWYERWSIRAVDMTRPFLDRGVPPQFHFYDLPFLRWLHITGKAVDVLSQHDLEHVVTGDSLARAYELIVFPGHHEYVTTREYDVVRRYRNLGGNLMFLSANNFYWQAIKRGPMMSRIRRYRDQGRPEASLVGVQLVASGGGKHRGPYRILRSSAGEWLFAGSGLAPGSTFGTFGIEIDHVTRASPKGIEVIAELRGVFGLHTGQMTYYETTTGAKVFAAGAFTLAGFALVEPVSTMLENLWNRLAVD